MKRKRLKFLVWVGCFGAAFLMIYGILKLATVELLWAGGLSIILGVVFIIVGVYCWKASKNVY